MSVLLQTRLIEPLMHQISNVAPHTIAMTSLLLSNAFSNELKCSDTDLGEKRKCLLDTALAHKYASPPPHVSYINKVGKSLVEFSKLVSPIPPPGDDPDGTGQVIGMTAETVMTQAARAESQG